MHTNEYFWIICRQCICIGNSATCLFTAVKGKNITLTKVKLRSYFVPIVKSVSRFVLNGHNVKKRISVKFLYSMLLDTKLKCLLRLCIDPRQC